MRRPDVAHKKKKTLFFAPQNLLICYHHPDSPPLNSGPLATPQFASTSGQPAGTQYDVRTDKKAELLPFCSQAIECDLRNVTDSCYVAIDYLTNVKTV